MSSSFLRRRVRREPRAVRHGLKSRTDSAVVVQFADPISLDRHGSFAARRRYISSARWNRKSTSEPGGNKTSLGILMITGRPHCGIDEAAH